MVEINHDAMKNKEDYQILNVRLTFFKEVTCVTLKLNKYQITST